MNAPEPSSGHRLHLADVEAGKTVRLVGVEHGSALRMRLMAMGLTPGVLVRVIQRVNGGPCIVAVRGTRVALGRGMLDRICVENLE
jgi:Fe2+ transport system protein FeoA